MKYLINIGHVALRELDIIIRKNRIYGFCMIVFPLLLVVFFTTMLDDGVAIDLPVGVVDQDNSATSRGLIRNLDAMQSSRVVYRFANVTEARNAMQEGKVYAYLLIPEGTSAKLLAGRQPKISYYYTMTCMTAGSMAMKDMKTIGTLGSAAVGQATLSAKGASRCRHGDEIRHRQGVAGHGRWQHRRGYRRQVPCSRAGVPARDIPLSMVYLRRAPLPSSRRRVEHCATHAPAGVGRSWLRHLRLRSDAVVAHVNEYLVAVVGALDFHVRFGIPDCRHGRTATGHVVVVPFTPLLDDLPGDGAQWLPRHRCMVPSCGTRGFHAVALVRA